MEYKYRIADQMLAKKLASKGAILIEGPKWCGKTTTAEQQANSILYMDNPASLETNLQMAEIDASVLLRVIHQDLLMNGSWHLNFGMPSDLRLTIGMMWDSLS